MDPPVPVPGQPSVVAISATATSISLSWSVPSGSVVTGSEVMWHDLSSGGSTAMTDDDEGSGTSGSITGTSYTISFNNSSNYSITIILVNAAGRSNASQPIFFSSVKGNLNLKKIAI